MKNKNNMKYIKTFESYSSVNEEFLGLDFSKMKQAVLSVKDAFEKDIFPSLSEEDKKALISKAEEFSKKYGVKGEEDMLSKLQSEVSKNSSKIEEISESMLNEGWDDVKAAFKGGLNKFKNIVSKLVGIFGIASLFGGIAAWASALPGYVDISWMAKLHDICEAILGTNSGPIGMLLMIVGVLLALGSMGIGYLSFLGPKRKD
jgi:hypothetical protein